MPNYIVNKSRQSNGDHEVHDTYKECQYMPDRDNQDYLGWHLDCHGAVNEAKRRGYEQVNGCYYCCEECHTQ